MIYLTGWALAGIIFGAVVVGGALGMFIMAAMVVSSDRRDDNE